MDIEQSIKVAEGWLEKPVCVEASPSEIGAIIKLVEFAKHMQWQPIEKFVKDNNCDRFWFSFVTPESGGKEFVDIGFFDPKTQSFKAFGYSSITTIHPTKWAKIFEPQLPEG